MRRHITYVAILFATLIALPQSSTQAAGRRADNSQQTTTKAGAMKPVTVINRLVIKAGKIDEFIDIQVNYASSLMEKPVGLVGSRLYRGVDNQTVVLVSQFESVKAQEEIRRLPAFKQNLGQLQALVESSSPALYEEAHSTGSFK
jgi:heme-degrading monooxygenase HmoA